MSKAKVLLAEDDPSLAFMIRDNLEDAGFEVVHASDGDSAWEQYQENNFDICLLDVMMPQKDGFWVAKKIRQKSDIIPILFLTAKSLEEDRIRGFQTGADDYIIKPFSMQELLMRMDVFLRRTKKLTAETKEEYTVGRLKFSYPDLKIFAGNEIINLTQREADLLRFLAQHPDKILKREEILLNVWGKDDYFLGRSMDVFFTKLRKYLKVDPSINIETIHGVGYRMNIR